METVEKGWKPLLRLKNGVGKLVEKPFFFLWFSMGKGKESVRFKGRLIEFRFPSGGFLPDGGKTVRQSASKRTEKRGFPHFPQDVEK